MTLLRCDREPTGTSSLQCPKAEIEEIAPLWALTPNSSGGLLAIEEILGVSELEGS